MTGLSETLALKTGTEGSAKNEEEPCKEHTWSCESLHEAYLLAYVLQEYLREISTDHLKVVVKRRGEFFYGVGQSCSILHEGKIIYGIGGKAFEYEIDTDCKTQTIKANHDIRRFVKQITEHIYKNNPLRRNHLHIVPSGDGLRADIKPWPSIEFEDLIMPDRIKEDLYDNTVLHLQEGEGNNGIILYGPPGTGKSLACQAVIAEALQLGFSSCYLVGNAPFDQLDRLVDSYLSPCLVVLEDIDTFIEDRRDGRQTYFADFLQFMSGLNDRRGKFVVIATTNHLEFLDEAVTKRPVRFNRKYQFGYPSNEVLDQLLDFYFGKGSLSPDLRACCYERKFTGAHISEIKRTAQMLSVKHQKSVHEMFGAALEIVAKQFETELRPAGFGGRG